MQVYSNTTGWLIWASWWKVVSGCIYRIGFSAWLDASNLHWLISIRCDFETMPVNVRGYSRVARRSLSVWGGAPFVWPFYAGSARPLIYRLKTKHNGTTPLEQKYLGLLLLIDYGCSGGFPLCQDIRCVRVRPSVTPRMVSQVKSPFLPCRRPALHSMTISQE